MNIPNLISLGRLMAVPVIVWLILEGRMSEAFWLFIAAGISDAIDGYIAKKFQAETEFGRYLDPIADKVLLVSVYITMGQVDLLDAWVVILVVFRDLVIVGGALLFQIVTQTLQLQPLFISKVNTTAQIVLAAVVLGELGLEVNLMWLRESLIYGVALTTLWSGALYIVTWSRLASVMEDGK